MEDIPELVQKLVDNLINNEEKCTICFETIKRGNLLWSCPCCYAVLHLICTKKWLASCLEKREKLYTSSDRKDKFSCPTCGSLVDESSCSTYRCYCGKVENPKVDPMLVPGSCGQTCERRLAGPKCPHRCPLQCHPGPCMPCRYTCEQTCYCGKESKIGSCSSMVDGFECGKPCGRLLDCGQHRCEVKCHDSICPICKVLVNERCYCGATSRRRRCGKESGFSCQKRCTKLRNCGKHECGVTCHAGSCSLCPRLPWCQHFCPCGKTEITIPRTSCTDPIPSCGKPCEIPLQCGHLCWYSCHDDSPCAPCREMVREYCACRRKEYTFPCFCTRLPKDQWAEAARVIGIPIKELPPSYPLRCKKVCRKMLSCKKHTCNSVCCSDIEHICTAICLKKLSCGQHQCGSLCHTGSCKPCENTSFQRLYCRCKRTFIEPPVPCGTKPPPCNHPCSIPRPCGHPANHSCHIEPECPECVVLVEKTCASHGNPLPYPTKCFLTNISCGKRCGKVLLCCGKMCNLTCHGGNCKHDCTAHFPTLSSVLKKISK